MAGVLGLGRRFLRGAEGKARAGGGVLAIDGIIPQEISHIGSHQQNVGVAVLDDPVALSALIEGEFETIVSAHQPQDPSGTLFVPFLNLLQKLGSILRRCYQLGRLALCLLKHSSQ
jgi:hypothetical protein